MLHIYRRLVPALGLFAGMPGISGVEQISRLQERGCGVRRCLLASGNWTTAAAAQALAMGCEVIQKPFELEAIERWIVVCHDGLDPERLLIKWDGDINPMPKRAP